jgi:hypothetical protein
MEYDEDHVVEAHCALVRHMPAVLHLAEQVYASNADQTIP